MNARESNKAKSADRHFSASSIEISNVSKFYRKTKTSVPTPALVDASLSIDAASFVCLVGPSGCGKSTLLNIIAGFIQADKGAVLVGGQAVQGPAADRGMIFQAPTLFDWMTVRENVLFGPKAQKRMSSEVMREAEELLEIVGLAAFIDHYPSQLSGGMKQRLAIARSLINKPSVLLLDEPFAALDAITREHMQTFLQTLWAKYGMTVVFVTHDVEEAALLADKVAVMSARPGRITTIVDVGVQRPREVDTPEQLEVRRRIRLNLAGRADHE